MKRLEASVVRAVRLKSVRGTVGFRHLLLNCTLFFHLKVVHNIQHEKVGRFKSVRNAEIPIERSVLMKSDQSRRQHDSIGML